MSAMSELDIETQIAILNSPSAAHIARIVLHTMAHQCDTIAQAIGHSIIYLKEMIHRTDNLSIKQTARINQARLILARVNHELHA